MKFKNLLLLILTCISISACGDLGFSPQSLAMKQVPSDNDSNDNNIDVPDTGANETPKATLFLRDKVLFNSDISEIALDNALNYFDQNKAYINNEKIITIFDVTQHSSKKRLYVIDTENGNVRAIHSAHGSNSDTDKNGYATSFSNANGSNQTSLGFMLTGETYYSGKNGLSLKLDGLESRNSRVRPRLVVIHGANYVNENTSSVGRSFGCPAISHTYRDWYINTAKNGSLLYIYHADNDGV